MSDLSTLSHEELLRKYAHLDRMGGNAGNPLGTDIAMKRSEAHIVEILARMSSAEPDWQPIETAPTHDWLDVWDKSVGLPFVLALRPTGFWIRLSYGAVPKDYAEENFTYWAPRPKGPA